MFIFLFFFGEKKKFVLVVKECLQFIIVYEWVGGWLLVDYLLVLQKELVVVILKYVYILNDDICVSFECQDDFEVFEVKIEIL